MKNGAIAHKSRMFRSFLKNWHLFGELKKRVVNSTRFKCIINILFRSLPNKNHELQTSSIQKNGLFHSRFVGVSNSGIVSIQKQTIELKIFKLRNFNYELFSKTPKNLHNYHNNRDNGINFSRK